MKKRLGLVALTAAFTFLTLIGSTLHAQRMLPKNQDKNVPDGTRKCIKPKSTDRFINDLLKPAEPLACFVPVINTSARVGNESETYVVVNPTNTNQVVVFSNLSSENSIFRAYSTTGGATWTRGTVATAVACCDAQAAWDNFGNLFMVYINSSVNQINVILSTDGGATFGAPVTAGTGSVDQPSIAVGNGSVWVDWNSSGSMVARGAPVTGLGVWGPFGAQQSIPSAAGSFGGIAVGPGPNGGKVIATYQSPTGGQGPATIFSNTDADGLGAGGFGAQVTVSTTNVGGFDFIPAQNGRSIDSEAGMVWDATGGLFNNRIYLVYTEETANENNDTDILVRTSTNDGATWSAPVRVNDDPASPIRSQFLPYITLDRTTGTVGVSFYDARNDNGVAGTGGTNAIANDDGEYFGTFSTDGGATWAPNTRLSGGFSNADASNNGIDYGDYIGQDAHAGKLYAVWADNANCDGTNPNGTLQAFDLYINNSLTLPGAGYHVTTSIPACNSLIGSQPADFVINLSAAVNTSTVEAADFTVNGTPSNVAPTFGAGNTQITFHFSSTPVVQGPNTMHIADGAFNDFEGNPVVEFNCTFNYDALPLQVTSTNPPVGGGFTGPGSSTYDVNFSEAVNPASVQTTDLTLSGVAGSTVSMVSVINANTTARFTLNFTSIFSGTLTASIAAGAVTDQFGNPNLAFSGNYSYTGSFCPTLTENFDGVTPPMLPAGWTATQGTNAGAFPFWVSSNAGTPTPVADSLPNAMFSQDPTNLLDNRLETPTVMFSTANSTLTFRQNYSLEQQSATSAYDAGVLEISINGGAYQDVVAAGGTFTSGGYNHTSINTGFSNPCNIAAPTHTGSWSGISNGGAGGFETVTMTPPAAAVGQPVKLRFRMCSDNTVSRTGWRVDSLAIYEPCPATVTGAVSRKPHGGVGSFDIDMPLMGTTGVECRSGGVTNDFTLVVTFANNVSVSGSPQAQVTSGVGCVGIGGTCDPGGAVSVAGNVVTIQLTTVDDQQTINVTLNGVNTVSAADEPAVNVVIPMSRLLGDTNANRVVNASDIAQTKAQIGQPLTSSNFRSDINVNGAMNASDAAQVKANSGHAVP